MGTSLYDQFQREHGGSPPAPTTPLYQRFLSEQSSTPPTHDYHAEFSKGLLGKRMASENAQEKATDPTIGTELLGTAASLARDVPGGEVLQTLAAQGASHVPGLRPANGPLSYRQARDEIHDAEDQAGGLGTVARGVGGALSMAAVPGSATTKGALYGALHGFTDADPDADRRAETIQQGAMGGVLGAGTEALGAIGSHVGSHVKSRAAAQLAKEKGVLDAVKAAGRDAKGKVVGAIRDVRASYPPAPSAAPSPANAPTLEGLLTKMRAEQPHEVGNQWGDAEIAMGLDKPQPDLEDLLRRSIIAKGGRPITPPPAPP